MVNIGPRMLFNFESENMKKFISHDIEELDKFFTIINTSKFSVVDSNKAYDNFIISILNLKFKIEYKDISEVFTNMNSLITNMSMEELENI